MNDRDVRPFIVSAPLKLNDADILNTETIYIFDYSSSFLQSNDKPTDFINYLEKFGGMVDIIITEETSFDEREQLILKYFDSGSFFNSYSMVQTMISILFIDKDIPYNNKWSLLNDMEIRAFLTRNRNFIDNIEKFLNSLFLVMLLLEPNKEITSIKYKFGKDRICKDELSPNICTLLLSKDFYQYYDKHIGSDLYYYEFMFENRLYKQQCFEDILMNSENNLFQLLKDLNNPKFQEFIKNKKQS